LLGRGVFGCVIDEAGCAIKRNPKFLKTPSLTPLTISPYSKPVVERGGGRWRTGRDSSEHVTTRLSRTHTTQLTHTHTHTPARTVQADTANVGCSAATLDEQCTAIGARHAGPLTCCGVVHRSWRGSRAAPWASSSRRRACCAWWRPPCSGRRTAQGRRPCARRRRS